MCEYIERVNGKFRSVENEKVPKRGKGRPNDAVTLQMMWTSNLDGVARGTPDDVRRIKEVAGPTEVTVCKSVVITRIQPTPKSFRKYRGDFVFLQSMSNA